MKMTDEMFLALNFKKDGDYWTYLEYKGNYHDISLGYYAKLDVELEDVIKRLKTKWVEEAEDNLRSSFRSLLGIYKSKSELY